MRDNNEGMVTRRCRMGWCDNIADWRIEYTNLLVTSVCHKHLPDAMENVDGEDYKIVPISPWAKSQKKPKIPFVFR